MSQDELESHIGRRYRTRYAHDGEHIWLDIIGTFADRLIGRLPSGQELHVSPGALSDHYVPVLATTADMVEETR